MATDNPYFDIPDKGVKYMKKLEARIAELEAEVERLRKVERYFALCAAPCQIEGCFFPNFETAKADREAAEARAERLEAENKRLVEALRDMRRLMHDSLGGLKGAIRPLLDERPHSELTEIRKAFNAGAGFAAQADSIVRAALSDAPADGGGVSPISSLRKTEGK
jgi:cell division protein FtsB